MNQSAKSRLLETGTGLTLVFDVNETLLDLKVLDPIFEHIFGESNFRREWFSQLILYSQSVTLANRYVPFGTLAIGVLRMLGRSREIEIGEGEIQSFVAAMGSLPAHPDVKPSLDRLRAHGFRLVTLTNSSFTGTHLPIEAAGLGHYFDHNFSVVGIAKFKPHPSVYRMVADKLGIDPQEICMVACHVWDLIGAQALGCKTAFVMRPDNSGLVVEGIPQPDFIAKDMADLADQFCS